jgi:hypothetical protein
MSPRFAGNVADVEELPQALDRIVKMLDRNKIERSTVTLVFDKGTAALDNTLLLKEAGLGWISALPWNAPVELRERDIETLPAQLRCCCVAVLSLCVAVHPICHSCAMRLLSAWNLPILDTRGRKIPSECDVSDIYAYCLFSVRVHSTVKRL